MKRLMKFLSIIATVMILLSASLAVAQQATPDSAPPRQMQSPAQTQVTPSLQQTEQMQNMDKMATSMTQMAEMCKMMMDKQMAGMPYIMTAGIAIGVMVFLDLLLLLILEILWIIYWSRKLKTERR
jgi:uncharacterized membrane protein YeiB